MSTLRHIITTRGTAGQSDQQVVAFEKSEIMIGRGGRSEILLHSRRVSLEHARLTVAAEGLTIEDLNSFSGILVNSQIVKKAQLKNGDVVRLGDVTLGIAQDEKGIALLEDRDSTAGGKWDESLRRRAELLHLEYHFPSFRILAILFVTLVVVGCFFWPVDSGKLSLWSSGPISNPHAVIAEKCTACHAKPFVPVRDAECEVCHRMTDHAAAVPTFVHKHPFARSQCTDCHLEHRGDQKLILRESKLCIECHANMRSLLPDSIVANISSFVAHPQFGVTVLGESSKISLDDKTRLHDPTHIKLNHSVHLTPGLLGAAGRVTLDCSSCHVPNSEKRGFVPITFQKNCASCHPLTFDERLAGKTLPHAEPDVVFNAIYAEYAKLFLSSQSQKAATGEIHRTLPGRPTAESLPPPLSLSRQGVENESRAAETQLFTKTTCLLCHDVSEKRNQNDATTSAELLQSHYQITKPNIPSVWMPNASFNHQAHQDVRCDSCHSGVRKSKLTSDVLLPGIEKCGQCHSDETGKPNRVRSDCALCHSYHDQLQLKDSRKKQIEAILYELGTNYPQINLPGAKQ